MTEAINSSAGGTSRISQQWATWGAGAVVAALIADVLFNVSVKTGEQGGTGSMLAVGAVLIVVGAVLYLAVLPRVRDDVRGAVVLGIVTVLTLAAFWSGAPLLIAPAAVLFAMRARESSPARIAAGLAVIAALVDLIAAIGNAV